MPMRVPFFSTSQIQEANACAVLLWNGKSYIDDKRLQNNGGFITSDKSFLLHFQNELPRILHGNAFNLDWIEDLKITARMTALRFHEQNISFPLLSRFIRRRYPPTSSSVSNSISNDERLRLTNNWVVDCGFNVVRNNRLVNRGYRLPLASRILFFCQPDWLIFNYAKDFSHGVMGFSAAPHIGYPMYASEMLAGLRRNWTELSQFNIPTVANKKISVRLATAYNSHWWARRVLDLALLVNLGKVPVIPNIINERLNCPEHSQSVTLCPCP